MLLELNENMCALVVMLMFPEDFVAQTLLDDEDQEIEWIWPVGFMTNREQAYQLATGFLFQEQGLLGGVIDLIWVISGYKKTIQGEEEVGEEHDGEA